MGWSRSLGSLKCRGSFAKETYHNTPSLKPDTILQQKKSTKIGLFCHVDLIS